MGVKRVIDSDFWKDDKVIDEYSIEDKYFMLYLYTCPNSELLGMYKLPLKIISFETGYTIEIVRVLLDRFQNKYNIIIYDFDTQEIFIKNYIKKAIITGGKPIFDAFVKRWGNIKSIKLKSEFVKYHKIVNLSNNTLIKLLEHIGDIDYDNDLDNDYDYDRLVSRVVTESVPKEKKTKRFKPPTIEEIREYCLERNNGIDPEAFFHHYEAVNWFRGKIKVTNWKSCVITWERRNKDKPDSKPLTVKDIWGDE